MSNCILISTIQLCVLYRIWEPSKNLATKCRLSYNNDMHSMDWVHQGSSDNLVGHVTLM